MAETLADNDWSEHYVKRGDPKKPTYYIIRPPRGGGLFYIYNQVAGNIRYALSKKYLPVVDMQNYSTVYLAPEKLGKENAWEYFFEQPLGISLEEAYNGENIILSTNSEFPVRPYESMAFYENRNNILTEWRMLVKLGLLKVKPEIIAEISALRQKLFAPNDRVLGVHLRGTDYMLNKPYMHPIPPPPLNFPQVLSLPSSKSGGVTKFSLRRKIKISCRFLSKCSAICA